MRAQNFGPGLSEAPGWRTATDDFLKERETHLFERRGFGNDEARVVQQWWKYPRSALQRIEALAAARRTADFDALAVVYKRVKNITKDVLVSAPSQKLVDVLREPAELELAQALATKGPLIHISAGEGRYAEAFRLLATLREPLDRFFKDVMVMVDDVALRDARLDLLMGLRHLISINIGDIAMLAPEEAKQ